MFVLTKISLILMFTTLAILVAESLEVLDSAYADFIMSAILALQIVLLVAFVAILVMKRRIMNGVKIMRYHFNDRLIKGATDILPENISPTNPRKTAVFKVLLEIRDVDEPPEFGISKICTGTKTSNIGDHVFNIISGIADNNFLFTADIIVRPGEKINFQLKKDANVKLFLLGELYIP